jgi:hypothetical protein
VDQDSCLNCQKGYSDCTDYYILGLKLGDIFASSDSVKRHMGHWVHREEWLNREELHVSRKELWHGDRFRELSYFWDPDQETQIPEICPTCQTIITVDEINLNSDEGNVDDDSLQVIHSTKQL